MEKVGDACHDEALTNCKSLVPNALVIHRNNPPVASRG
jgi:hypothetical protein